MKMLSRAANEKHQSYLCLYKQRLLNISHLVCVLRSMQGHQKKMEVQILVLLRQCENQSNIFCFHASLDKELIVHPRRIYNSTKRLICVTRERRSSIRTEEKKQKHKYNTMLHQIILH
jgi:hypothetical protein